MATWQQFATAAPALAERGRRLMQIEHPLAPVRSGLAYLATVRASDGGPRVHPISPAIHEGRLYAFVRRETPKYGDLRRDPRFALHSWAPEETEGTFVDDEWWATGRAELVADRAITLAVAGLVGDDPTAGDVFELDLATVFTKDRPDGHVRYERWDADAT